LHTENDEDPALMRRIDGLFTTWPFLGSRRMTAMLRAEGQAINRQRVQRLMRKQVALWRDPAHAPRFYSVDAHGLERRDWLNVVKDRLEGRRLTRRRCVERRNARARVVREWRDRVG
jgi:hypothetical protein